MGTNYYVVEEECSECGRQERNHIGKSSAGWYFLVDCSHGNYDDYESLCDYLRSCEKIENEYGDKLTVPEMVDKMLYDDTDIELKEHGHSEYGPDDYWHEDVDGTQLDFCNHSFS